MSFNNLNNLNSLGSLGSGGGSAPFNPSNYGTVAAWYKADVGAYNVANTTLATDGQQVVQWQDQSGNTHHLQGTATFNADSGAPQNHLPNISFNGTSDALYKYTGFSGLVQPEHVFAVIKRITNLSSSGGRVLSGGIGNNMIIEELSATQLVQNGNLGGGSIQTVPALGNYFIFDALYSGAASTFRINNGTPGGSSGIGTAAAGGLTLAQYPGPGGNPANVAYCELLVYSTALSDPQAAIVNHYLGSRWGITTS